jgi:hypothetical protein
MTRAMLTVVVVAVLLSSVVSLGVSRVTCPASSEAAAPASPHGR